MVCVNDLMFCGKRVLEAAIPIKSNTMRVDRLRLDAASGSRYGAVERKLIDVK